MSWVPIPVKRYLSNLLTDYVERGGDADLGAVTADVIDTEDLESTKSATFTGDFDPLPANTINYTYTGNTVDGIQQLESSTGDTSLTTDSGVRMLLSLDAVVDAWKLGEDLVFASWNYPTWGKRRKLRLSFWIDNSSEQFGFGTGRVNINNLSASSHIGIRIDNGTLYATVASADQSSQSETQLRTGLSGGQHELYIDFDGNTDGTGTADVTVNKYPIDGSTTPEWTETHTFDAASDPVPQGKESAQAYGWTAWSAMAKTPNGEATDVHLNRAEYTLFPDAV